MERWREGICPRGRSGLLGASSGASTPIRIEDAQPDQVASEMRGTVLRPAAPDGLETTRLRIGPSSGGN